MRRATATASFQGTIDDARVYNRALSAAEIQALVSDNHPPVANADNHTTPQDMALNVAAPGVLGNDTDADGDPLTAIKVSDPAHGTLNSFGSNGSFMYTPAAGYSGPDSFTYKANDGMADSNVATVTLTVTPPDNHAPALMAIGNQAVNEGSLLTFTASATDQDLATPWPSRWMRACRLALASTPRRGHSPGHRSKQRAQVATR